MIAARFVAPPPDSPSSRAEGDCELDQLREAVCERFWAQLRAAAPKAYLAEGTALTVVVPSSDPLVSALTAWFEVRTVRHDADC